MHGEPWAGLRAGSALLPIGPCAAARLLASGLLVLALALASGAAQAAPRVVSLNPSLTAIVLALGAARIRSSA